MIRRLDGAISGGFFWSMYYSAVALKFQYCSLIFSLLKSAQKQRVLVVFGSEIRGYLQPGGV